MNSTHQPAAVILAGGAGSRLGGVIKANIEVGGRRLLDRVAAVLEVEANPLLVAHGRIDPTALGLPPEMVPVSDLDADRRGPIAGLAAAAAYLETIGSPAEFLLCAAVDTPFLPPDFVARLMDLAASTGAPAIVAGYAGQPYPTNALWRRTALRDLPQRTRDNTAPHSLRRLAEELSARQLDWPPEPAGDPFASINTPDDLARLASRADPKAPR